MSQLELFHGAHVAFEKCRHALKGGDVRAARQAIGDPESSHDAADARRLEQIEKGLELLGGWKRAEPRALHELFEAALADPVEARPGRLRSSDWFRAYALGVAQALARTPAERFRGWCGLHFALGAGLLEEARAQTDRLLPACDESWAWLEAARVAGAAGERGSALRRALVACLAARGGLHPDPPPIVPALAPALNPPEGALPRLPRDLEELWVVAEELRLDAPASAWVPALGVLDGVHHPSLLAEPDVIRATGFDPDAPPSTGEPLARAFLRALLSARRARERERRGARGGCGDEELRARNEMRRAAPVLLARYLQRLTWG